MKSQNKTETKSYGERKISKIDLEETFKQESEVLISSLKKELSKIKEINALVLFGSFAREDYSKKHSDLDIMLFIDKPKKDQKLEEKILKKIISLSLDKKISIHTLFQYKKLEEEDKSLMLTIAQEGQVLFAKKTLLISKNILGLKNYFLIKFSTSNTKPVIKNKLQRFLHGYTIKGKHYKGIVDNEIILNAGKGAIIVPEEMLQKVLFFAKDIGVEATQKAKFYK